MFIDQSYSHFPERPAIITSVAGIVLALTSCTGSEPISPVGGDDSLSPSACVGLMPTSWSQVEPQENIAAFADVLDTSVEEAEQGITGTAECVPGIRYDQLITGYAFRVHGVSERCVAFAPAFPDKKPRVDTRYQVVKAFCVV